MATKKLPKITTVTKLRYETADIVSDITKTDIPYAITKDSEYVAVLVSPSYYEKTASAYELLLDMIDTKDLEGEIDQTKNEKGIDFEAYLKKQNVQNHPKEKTSEIS